MKKVIKKNQVIITALSIMIAVAGYLNFAGKDLAVNSQGTVASEAENAAVNAEAGEGDAGEGDVAESAAKAGGDDAALSEDVAADAKKSTKDSTNKEGKKTTEAVDTMDISDADAASLTGADGNSDDAEVSASVKDGEEGTDIGEAVLTAANAADFVTKAKFNREQTRAKSKETLMDIIDDKNISESQKQKAIDQMLQMTDTMEKETQTEQLLGAKGFLNSVVTMSSNSVDVLVTQSEISDVEKAQIEDIVSRTADMEMDRIVISTMKTEK